MSFLPSLVHFYSNAFLIFFGIVWAGYWLLPHRGRNLWLLLASYLFYASWNWHFFPLLLLSTITNYYCAILMNKRPAHRKLFFGLCLATDLSLLFFFKYLGPVIGQTIGSWEIILPLGISFYTFQSLSYSIDVYKGRLAPERNFPKFALFVAFFPQLIAGPIERAAEFLPQEEERKVFSRIPWRAALYLFVFGLFKKRVFGDYFAIFARQAFDAPDAHGWAVAAGILAYSLQAYCDISGYTDMARGLALALGFRLNRNFYFPFFSRNPAEFWDRWHASLTSWVKHYIYIPLLVKTRRPNLSITLAFLFVSLWYGPHLHYLVWGLYWAAVVLFYHHCLKGLRLPTWVNASLGRGATLLALVLGLSLFRAPDLSGWLELMARVPTGLGGSLPFEAGKLAFCATALLLYDLLLFLRDDELLLTRLGFYAQAAFYIFLFFIYRNIGSVAELDFIYYKF